MMRPALILVLAVVPACASAGGDATAADVAARLDAIESRLGAIESQPTPATPTVWLRGTSGEAVPQSVLVRTVVTDRRLVPGPGDCVLPLPAKVETIRIDGLSSGLVVGTAGTLGAGKGNILRFDTTQPGVRVIRLEKVPAGDATTKPEPAAPEEPAKR